MLTELEDGLPARAGDAGSGPRLGVAEVELSLPVESRIEHSGLSLTAPRGRMVTGFAIPHGRLRVCFVREVT